MKILKGIDADILHVNSDFSIAQIAYLYKRHSKAALVYTYHTMYEDYTYYITKGFMDRASKWIIREYSLATCEKANVVISPSYKTLNYYKNGNKRIEYWYIPMRYISYVLQTYVLKK